MRCDTKCTSLTLDGYFPIPSSFSIQNSVLLCVRCAVDQSILPLFNLNFVLLFPLWSAAATAAAAFTVVYQHLFLCVCVCKFVRVCLSVYMCPCYFQANDNTPQTIQYSVVIQIVRNHWTESAVAIVLRPNIHNFIFRTF